MRCTIGPMKKRILAAFLWFYAGWYGGAILADFLGVSPLLGPIIGAAVAALVVGDPRRIIWTAPHRQPGRVPRPRPGTCLTPSRAAARPTDSGERRVPVVTRRSPSPFGNFDRRQRTSWTASEANPPGELPVVGPRKNCLRHTPEMFLPPRTRSAGSRRTR